MDRMEEYAALQAQLEEHPSALAYTVQRARARRGPYLISSARRK